MTVAFYVAMPVVSRLKTVLQILLDDGSKVSQRNVDGSTPLHVAAVNGSASVARVRASRLSSKLACASTQSENARLYVLRSSCCPMLT